MMPMHFISAIVVVFLIIWLLEVSNNLLNCKYMKSR